MLVVINVDAYPFLALSDLICHLADTVMVFFGCTVPPDSQETELRSSNQEVSPSADKNTRVVLVSYCACSVSLQLFLVMWTFHVSGCHLLQQMSKRYFKDWCLMNSQPTFLILTSF